MNQITFSKSFIVSKNYKMIISNTFSSSFLSKQNFFLTKNNQKIHYEFINNKSLTTIIFLHGLMSNIQSKKAKHLKKFVNKNKIID